ncbi:hypothetical protein JL720_12860 [Aureococcus anophagefferens]|nr:hypothetical protein JL720_12860 [Aureococcus anophagefferens]
MRRRHLALLAAACLCVELTSSDQNDEMKNLLDRVTLLEERLRLTNIPELTDDEANERSLLEIFTDTIGDFVMHKLLPRSDAASPGGGPDAGPRLPAAAAGRAREACDPDVSGELGTLEKAATLVRTASARSWVAANRFLDAAAPPTDAECAWNWRLRSCDPPGRCELRYRFGDYHLGRACRLAGGAAFDDEDLFDARDAPFGEADDDRDAAPAADRTLRAGRPLGEADDDRDAAADLFGRADDDRDAADVLITSGWERIAKITLTLGATSSMSFAVARNLGRSPYSGVASKPHGGAPALGTAGNWRRARSRSGAGRSGAATARSPGPGAHARRRRRGGAAAVAREPLAGPRRATRPRPAAAAAAPAPTAAAAACVAGIDAPFEDQAAAVALEILERTGTNEVAFTVLDEAYGDMLRGVSRMAARNAMGAHFFYVSLHRATAEAACAFGDRVAYLAPSPEATKKDAVYPIPAYMGKYYVAMLLCAARVRFFFFEMDVWLPPKGPATVLDAFRAAADSWNGGLHTAAAWALHEDNPYTINIGLYYVRSDVEPRNFDFFATMLSYARRHPLVFDQGLLNCVLKRMSSSKRLTFIRERDNCREHLVDVNDTALVRLIAAARNEPDVAASSRLSRNYNFTMVDAAAAVSYATPFLFRDSLAMHVLTSIPLSSAHGKKTVAKEMMLWEGDDGYYAVGGGRRYVMLDGSLAPPTGADDFRVLAARVRELVAFAAATNRTLVLPPAWHLARKLPSWEIVDTKSLDEIGVDWREATFLENPRLAVDDAAAFVRVAATPTGAAAARYCGYKHREKRRVALLASHLECGAQLATEAKLQRHLAAKRAARLRNKELRARGLPEDADDEAADPYAEVPGDEVDDGAKPDMLSRPGRQRRSAAFAARLADVVSRLAPPKPPHRRVFGPVPSGFARDFGFWQPGFSEPDALS